jgi:hypothetical protein
VKPSFKSHVSSRIELAAAQNVRQSFDLEVGEVAEKVTSEMVLSGHLAYGTSTFPWPRTSLSLNS